MTTYNQADVAVASFGKAESLTATKQVLNQSVADLSVAHSILHQIHWYMRGQGFLVYHPKMDDYMEELDGYLDEISERLITLGGSPFSTLKEFSEQSKLTESPGDFNRSMTDHLGRVVEVFRYLVGHFQDALDATDQDGDDVSNDIYVGAKGSLEKHIWMLEAELGKSPGL